MRSITLTSGFINLEEKWYIANRRPRQGFNTLKRLKRFGQNLWGAGSVGMRQKAFWDRILPPAQSKRFRWFRHGLLKPNQIWFGKLALWEFAKVSWRCKEDTNLNYVLWNKSHISFLRGKIPNFGFHPKHCLLSYNLHYVTSSKNRFNLLLWKYSPRKQ